MTGQFGEQAVDTADYFVVAALHTQANALLKRFECSENLFTFLKVYQQAKTAVKWITTNIPWIQDIIKKV